MSEDDYVPLSALQHLVFCERQCALIHVEQLWVDNRLTVEGSQLHSRVDEANAETRHDVRTARGLQLISHALRLVGRADVVEFRRYEPAVHESSTRPCDGWTVRPVEYKRGRPKTGRSDEVQLCAQAMCLEEMLEVRVECGVLYYARTRQRVDVQLDLELRSITKQCADRLHRLLLAGKTPRVKRQPKCQRCSMFEVCLPNGTGPDRSASAYFETALRPHVPR